MTMNRRMFLENTIAAARGAVLGPAAASSSIPQEIPGAVPPTVIAGSQFPWTDGDSQRYGLTYVDSRDQMRTVKDSGLWYRRVAGSNRLLS